MSINAPCELRSITPTPLPIMSHWSRDMELPPVPLTAVEQDTNVTKAIATLLLASNRPEGWRYENEDSSMTPLVLTPTTPLPFWMDTPFISKLSTPTRYTDAYTSFRLSSTACAEQFTMDRLVRVMLELFTNENPDGLPHTIVL